MTSFTLLSKASTEVDSSNFPTLPNKDLFPKPAPSELKLSAKYSLYSIPWPAFSAIYCEYFLLSLTASDK
jgi:hypothetical protein